MHHSRLIKTFFYSCMLIISTAQATTTNNTFFAPRAPLYNLPLQTSIWYSAAQQYNPNFGGSLQATAFFNRSMGAKKLGAYFGFADKNSFTINGIDTTGSIANGDIHPFFFNLTPSYVGTFTLNPHRSVYGMRLDYRQDLSKWLEGLYYQLSTPIVHVHTSMGFTEKITSNTNGGNTVQQTWQGGAVTSDWVEPYKYGKLSNSQSINGIADIDLTVGYTLLNREGMRFAYEALLTIPTSNAPRGEFLFEPVAGSGSHWAFGTGINGFITAWQDAKNDEHRLDISLNANYRYLFEGKEKRLLSLQNKPWGHFIRMRKKDPSSIANVLVNATPGPNVLTRTTHVTPGLQAECMASVDYTRNSWQTSFGYTLWARAQESVRLHSAWGTEGTYGLVGNTVVIDDAHTDGGFFTGGTTSGDIDTAGIFFPDAKTLPQLLIAESAAHVVSSASTIAKQATSDGTFFGVQDLKLAGHPTSISHTFSGSVGYALNTDTQSFIGGGGSIEISSAANPALSSWSLWAKYGVSF